VFPFVRIGYYFQKLKVRLNHFEIKKAEKSKKKNRENLEELKTNKSVGTIEKDHKQWNMFSPTSHCYSRSQEKDTPHFYIR
jgi:hypothetical protein